jgi:hypothetical protein
MKDRLLAFLLTAALAVLLVSVLLLALWVGFFALASAA